MSDERTTPELVLDAGQSARAFGLLAGARIVDAWVDADGFLYLQTHDHRSLCVQSDPEGNGPGCLAILQANRSTLIGGN